jgi:hypothetical protein
LGICGEENHAARPRFPVVIHRNCCYFKVALPRCVIKQKEMLLSVNTTLHAGKRKLCLSAESISHHQAQLQIYSGGGVHRTTALQVQDVSLYKLKCMCIVKYIKCLKCVI